jgi:hypothetical protein
MDELEVASTPAMSASAGRAGEHAGSMTKPPGVVWKLIVVALVASCAPATHPPAAPDRTAASSSPSPPASTGEPVDAAHPPAKPSLAKTYTAKERNQMTYCIALSETARRAAVEKLRGTPIDDVKKAYEGKPNARLNVATIDKVYKEHVSTAWDYAVGFFGECAGELAGVSRDRVKLASFCMQNQLIADVAFQYKTSGKPIEDAYAQFAQFKSSTPKAIVDVVYASTKDRAAIRMEVWNSCMADLSRG